MTDAVLLVAHGTVENLDDLPAFVLRIRHGRPPPPDLVAELRRRYEAIHGSPLLEITRAQAATLEHRLGLPVLVGMRLWEPSVEHALRDAAARGVQRLCVLPLAPYSVRVYCDAAERSLASVEKDLNGAAPALVRAEPWGTEPAYVEAHVARIRHALGSDGDAAVVMTAHSLPMRALQAGDAYEAEVRASAAAIAEQLGRPWRIAFQSQGADGGEWLGPDLRSVLEEVAGEGARRVLVAPIGFLADHVETLYDLDIEAAGWAGELGLELLRVPALNLDLRLAEALASVARRALG